MTHINFLIANMKLRVALNSLILWTFSFAKCVKIDIITATVLCGGRIAPPPSSGLLLKYNLLRNYLRFFSFVVKPCMLSNYSIIILTTAHIQHL